MKTTNTVQTAHVVHEDVKSLIDIITLSQNENKHKFSHMLHNCSSTLLESVFGNALYSKQYALHSIYGIPMRWRGYVPDGEVWLVDSTNTVIRRFSLHQHE